MKTLAVLCLLVVTACIGDDIPASTIIITDPPPSDAGPRADASAPSDAGTTGPVEGTCDDDHPCEEGACVDGVCSNAQCLPQGEECIWGGTPCCDGYCAAAYLTGHCAPRRFPGESCLTGDECQSNICAEGLCREPTCQAEQDSCYLDAECCNGFCTDERFDYVPGQCAVPRPAGASCTTGRWCLTNLCVDGVCR